MIQKADISRRRSKLSPAKQELLKKRLQSALISHSEAHIIPRHSRLDSIPLSFAQQRLWFLDQLEPGNPAYNMSSSYRLTGPLNIPTLKQSLNEIVRRHESLRTTFTMADGQLVQIISPTLTLSLPVIDLRDLPKTEREVQTQQVMAQEIRWAFDLAQGPLLRTTLLWLAEEEYILISVMHHIVSDGWSMGIFFRELTALYHALSAGKPSPLPELPIQYVDFAAWQRTRLQDEVLETQLAYWKQQFANGLPVLQLPTDHPRPATQTHRGARQSLALSKSTTDALKALSQLEESTLFMALLAAFKVLLYRYTGHEDIVIGSPIASRNRPDIEGLIGCFLNMLALRTDLSGHPTFRELVARVRKVTLEAYAHQDLPFEKLVEELHPERSLSYSSLFQVMFAFQNIPKQVLDLPDVTLRQLDVDRGTAMLDLTLFMWDTEQGLVGALEYNTDLFDSTTIERTVGHFQTLLENIVANPDQPIATLPLLMESEKHQLLVSWNDTRTGCSSENQCIHHLFEAQVDRTPDAIAVAFEEEELTYRELNRRANQLASYLHGLGVGPETLVSICLERSLEMIVAIVGVLKAGAAYIPLDHTYPKERLAFILEDTQASILLTQAKLAAGLPKAQDTQVICLDSDWEEFIATEVNEGNPVSRVTANNLAYIIYTSGSTGKPKGVMIQHSSLVNYIETASIEFELAPGDRILQFASISFDTAAEEIFPCLVCGATLVLRTDLMLDSLSMFLQKCHDWALTVLDLPTTFWHELTTGLDRESLTFPPSLRLVIIGGEKALPERVAMWQKHIDQRTIRLVNTYGPTEATVVATMCELLEVAEENDPLPEVSIGRAIRNVQTYILDQHLQPVPIGVPGELHLGGTGLARGYLNQPELTAEKFIPDPFRWPWPQSQDWKNPKWGGARLYKTGDLVRYLPDGNIEFLGRLDQQVKIRGFRIELEEIEAVLGQHEAVEEAIVMAQDTEGGSNSSPPTPNADKRLVAFVVPKQGKSLVARDLYRFLEQKVPTYMVPSAFVFLDALPLMSNGKVGRRILPVSELSRLDLGNASTAPQDTLELQLTKIWEQILGIHLISVKDNFFELGGHSLLAMHMIAQIEKITGKRLSLAALFRAPTIEQLADMLRQEGWSTPASSLVTIQGGGSKPPFFCLPGNLGNVFTDLGDLARYLDSDQPFYGLQDDIRNPIRIEAMATHYLDEIRAVQPEGPYFLGGICSGAVIAFEMAQQLHAQGQQVALLVLVEPSYPRIPGTQPYLRLAISILRRFIRRFSHHSSNLSQLGPTEQRTYISLKAKLIANSWALRRYMPKPYSGRIEIFMARESLKTQHNPRLDWHKFAAGAKIHKIPGNHNTITGENDTKIEEASMKALAEQLAVCIDNALAGDDRT